MVVGVVADVFDVVDDEGVAEGVLGEEDDLCASSCEGSDGGFSYTACSALNIVSIVVLVYMIVEIFILLPTPLFHAYSARSNWRHLRRRSSRAIVQ